MSALRMVFFSRKMETEFANIVHSEDNFDIIYDNRNVVITRDDRNVNITHGDRNVNITDWDSTYNVNMTHCDRTAHITHDDRNVNVTHCDRNVYITHWDSSVLNPISKIFRDNKSFYYISRSIAEYAMENNGLERSVIKCRLPQQFKCPKFS